MMDMIFKHKSQKIQQNEVPIRKSQEKQWALEQDTQTLQILKLSDLEQMY